MSISIEYAYDKNGNLTRDDNKGMTFTITGETGNLGVTYMPTDGGSGKSSFMNPSGIEININPHLSATGAAETFSHEAYGHALIYVETNGNRNKATHNYEGCVDKNQELIYKSIKARMETIQNFK